MAPVPPLADSALSLLHTAASNFHPTRTLPYLLNRQTTTTPPTATVTVLTDTNDANSNTDNNNNDPDGAKTLTGGAIAGIVIGSIAGFLILVWIIRSCTNLGAPPGEEAVPGEPWYGGVRDEYPPRHSHAAVVGERRGRSRGRSHSRESRGYHSHHHHHGGYHHGHGHGGSRSRSRRVSVTEAVPVQEVAPVVVRSSREERRRSRSRGYYGYGEAPVRGRSGSRGRY